MTKASLVDIVHDDQTRIGRALALFEERGHEIEPLGGDIYLVPSQDGKRTYRVQYGEHEFCSCPDHSYRDVTCIHIIAVGLSLAKRRRKSFTCVGCVDRFPVRERIEVTEDHDSLMWFVGDPLCRECAAATDIL